MNHKQRLERLQRELNRRGDAPAARPRIQVIEVYCDGELVEVLPLGAAALQDGQARAGSVEVQPRPANHANP